MERCREREQALLAEIQRMKEQNEQAKRDADLQELEDGAFGGMEGEDAV